MKSIPYGKQYIDQDDINRVVKVLKSDWISQGPTIRDFEEELARYTGAKYAVAVSSGTAALHLAALAAGLGPGAEAITTPITFLATSNAVLYTGAKPVFADIEYDSVNIDPAQIEKCVTGKTKAILPVHFAGLPVDLQEINQIAKKNKLVVIEDGCHALGAEYKGNKIGSCQYSDMTVFSFHPVKHITTGEGGAITTNNKKFYEKLLMFRNHGVLRSDAVKAKLGGWVNQMHELGFNYRITDIQCALGQGQLAKLDGFLKRRDEIARQYDAAFRDLGDKVQLPACDFEDRKHAWHLYLFRLTQKAGIKRREFFDELISRGILTQVHYIPVYQQPFYRKLFAGQRIQCPTAERYYEEVVSLPIFPTLKDAEVKYVVESVKDILNNQVKQIFPSPSQSRGRGVGVRVARIK